MYSDDLLINKWPNSKLAVVSSSKLGKSSSNALTNSLSEFELWDSNS